MEVKHPICVIAKKNPVVRAAIAELVSSWESLVWQLQMSGEPTVADGARECLHDSLNLWDLARCETCGAVVSLSSVSEGDCERCAERGERDARAHDEHLHNIRSAIAAINGPKNKGE